MPQESEDPEFAEALFEAVLAKTIPLDRSNGWGYQDPAHWERWHESLVETGESRGAAGRSRGRLHQRVRGRMERGRGRSERSRMGAALPQRSGARPGDPAPVYELQGVSKTFTRRNVHALDQIDLTLAERQLRRR